MLNSQFISGFNYKIKYRKASENINADFLSRNLLSNTNDNEITVYMISGIFDNIPITRNIFAKEAMKEVN